MINKTLSGWVRQTRYRAKTNNIFTNVSLDDIQKMLEFYDNKCGYCKIESYLSIDCVFPLKDGAPFVVANLLPICKKCKSIKKNNDLIWMFNQKHLNDQKYLEILEYLCGSLNGAMVREYVKQITGLSNE